MNRRSFFSLLAFPFFSCAFRPSSSRPLRVVVVGDSTVQTYPSESPIRGWGQYLGERFTGNVEVANLALSGRSTKTFRAEGHWEKALAIRGDWYLIQFGHNDSHEKGKPESTDAGTEYRENLRMYVDEVRAVGGRPVLVTPMHRRTFRSDGRLADILEPYAAAMKAVAKEKNVPMIDLHAASGKVFRELGDAGSADLSCSPADRTHFSEKGARLMAVLVAGGLIENVPGLGKYLRK
ncbi:MAG: rhamnogalacturonan acetylesterase [Candidatus Latescibacterota bacterium]